MKNNLLNCLILIVTFFATILSVINCLVGVWAEAAVKWAIFVKLVERVCSCTIGKLDSVKHSLECSTGKSSAKDDISFEQEVEQLLQWKALASADSKRKSKGKLTPFQISVLEQLTALPLGTACLGGSPEPFMLTAAPAPLGAICPAQKDSLPEEELPGCIDCQIVPTLDIEEVYYTRNIPYNQKRRPINTESISPLGEDVSVTSAFIDTEYHYYDGYESLVLVGTPRLIRQPQVFSLTGEDLLKLMDETRSIHDAPYNQPRCVDFDFPAPLGDAAILGWWQDSELERLQQIVESMSLDITQCGSLEPLMLTEAPAPLGTVAPDKDDPLGDELPQRPANRSSLKGLTNDQLREIIKNEIAPWAGSLALPKTKANKAEMKKFITNFYKSQASLG